MTLPTATSDDVHGGGAVLWTTDGAEVCASLWAGSYYCAHALWVTTMWAQTSTRVGRDRRGDPLVGFLHIPGDAETSAGCEKPRHILERHSITMRIVASAVRGILEELVGVRDKRILFTGFGPFAEVASNPSGELVASDDAAARMLVLATGRAPRARTPHTTGLGAFVVDDADGLSLGRLVLPVDDRCLDARLEGSLPWALQTFEPHAVVALGVHRKASRYHVEVEPTDAGLCIDDPTPRHEHGRAATRRAPHNASLARAIVRGAAATVVPSAAL